MLTCHNESETPIHFADYVLGRNLYVVKFERRATFRIIISPRSPSILSGLCSSLALVNAFGCLKLTAQFDT